MSQDETKIVKEGDKVVVIDKDGKKIGGQR